MDWHASRDNRISSESLYRQRKEVRKSSRDFSFLNVFMMVYFLVLLGWWSHVTLLIAVSITILVDSQNFICLKASLWRFSHDASFPSSVHSFCSKLRVLHCSDLLFRLVWFGCCLSFPGGETISRFHPLVAIFISVDPSDRSCNILLT